MDESTPTSPVLAGSHFFTDKISFRFSAPVAATGLATGVFDALHSTTVEAFDANGVALGTITNSQTGTELYGLFDNAGAKISGISIYHTALERSGFAIDNVTFGTADEVVPTPEPASIRAAWQCAGGTRTGASPSLPERMRCPGRAIILSASAPQPCGNGGERGVRRARCALLPAFDVEQVLGT